MDATGDHMIILKFKMQVYTVLYSEIKFALDKKYKNTLNLTLSFCLKRLTFVS